MDVIQISKNLGIKHNVCINVIDPNSSKVIQSHVGHNAATNSMLTGIGYYLAGSGSLNQGYDMLSAFVPQYISLGTMGLITQDANSTTGLPDGIGVHGQTIQTPEETRFTSYMNQCPGFGADGYDSAENNSRNQFGLGAVFDSTSPSFATAGAVKCELISDSFPRAQISFRDVVPEIESEKPETIDVVFSAYISTGALKQFRRPGDDYIFITECGLWSSKDWSDSGANGLLAGYRIVPPNRANWDMTQSANRQLLKEQIIRVGINQVVQVIWKVQLGSIAQLTSNN